MGSVQKNNFKEAKMKYLDVRSELNDLVALDVQENSSVNKDTIITMGKKVDLAFADLLDFNPLTSDVALEKATFIIDKIIISNDLPDYQKEALQKVLDDFTIFL